MVGKTHIYSKIFFEIKIMWKNSTVLHSAILAAQFKKTLVTLVFWYFKEEFIFECFARLAGNSNRRNNSAK